MFKRIIRLNFRLVLTGVFLFVFAQEAFCSEDFDNSITAAEAAAETGIVYVDFKSYR